VWETWAGRRGDVARALFYLDVRYEGGTHGVTSHSEPDLILTNNASLIVANTSSNQSVAYMGMLDTLIEWHNSDPVDAKEQWRNEVVYSYQGNRNPFIDNPSWVDCLFEGTCGSSSSDPWINEIHYDNMGGDVGEFVEVAGPSGTNLSGWSIVAYNGSNGTSYKTTNLSGTIPNQQNGYGTLSFNISGLQNGAPDGVALVDGSTVVEFLSYEGSFTATNGAANGQQSTDIGVSESNSSTPIGYSLQLGDSGWQAAQNDTPGQINTNQTFGGAPPDTTPPAVPTGIAVASGDGELDVDWNANGESDLAGYNIYRSTSSGGTYTKLNGGVLGINAYIDPSVTNGTTYWYKVSAVDDSGNESALSGSASGTPQAAAAVWINEFHYDDSGSDQNEGVEIAGTAGTSLAGWKIYLYNGNNDQYYSTINLSGAIDNEGGTGYGARWFSKSGIQNGGSDGIALVDDSDTLIQFISYEGTLTASNGPASGQTSVDVGVSEGSSSSSSQSLQFNGSSWVGPNNHSRGSINSGQSL
jgi:hypothetical protein